MRGECYQFEFIRKTETEKAMRALEQAKRSEQEWQELVKQGLATMVKEILPCREIRISYHML